MNQRSARGKATMWWRRYAALLVVGASTLAAAAALDPAVAGNEPDSSKMPTAPMREQVLRIAGDPARPVTLEATLFEPPGNGPFPLAVMNHGAKGDPRTAERYRISFSIDYLLSRGYAVIAPMMRGFAGSDGKAVALGCDDASIGRLNAHDILAVIDDIKARPEIDGSQVLVVGQSFGGWNALALATIAPPELKGVVDFVGGLRSSTCASQDEAMFDGMEQFGRDSRVPSLWFYGERDDEFPEKVWRTDYDRFTHAGGKAELVDFGTVDDAHNLLGHGDRLDLWVPKLNAYLAD
ncbi:MAG TPA: alpha/beta fold hydrolase, partial [Xanthomonadaceae bacterium]|nr:alpha/beta fold hydrolase [Xanthomonadaceae bacterium]